MVSYFFNSYCKICIIEIQLKVYIVKEDCIVPSSTNVLFIGGVSRRFFFFIVIYVLNRVDCPVCLNLIFKNCVNVA